MEKLDLSACFSFAWNTFKKRPWFFVGVTAFIFLLSVISSLFQNTSQQSGSGIHDGLGFIISIAITLYVAFGQTKLFLKAHDDVEGVHFKDFWKIKGFSWFVVLSFAAAIILIIAFILFIIPGIILSLMFMFATYILVDTGKQPIQALEESARITKGNRWMLLLFSLELIGINIIGVLLLVVGLFVTIPISLLATIHAYRLLQQAADKPVVVVE